MLIYIGVTGWGDHPSLYPENIRAKDKLAEYSSHFPVVEVDTAFYAIQPIRNSTKWVKETPDNFRFVIKAYQGMTGHQRLEDSPFKTRREMFQAFIESLRPFQENNKLAAILFQFPPWFDCRRENVDYLRYCKIAMEDIPIALEFRHESWFSDQYRSSTLTFMKKEGWIHSIVDEPQAGSGSIPTVPIVTDPRLTIVRLHGRNVYGWNKRKDENWREVRYLYKYNQRELLEWKKIVESLSNDTKDIIVLFNNNSGGDAARNAKQFQTLLDIEYEGLAPRQMDLF